MAYDMVGFVGLGRMGHPMALRLLAAGNKVVVFDLNADAVAQLVAAGAEAAGSAADVGARAERVLISLPTPDIVHAVVLADEGVAQGGKVKVIVDLSTTGPTMAKRVSKGLAPMGISWIEAPVSGGIKGAREGTLAVMVCGPKPAYDAVQPLLANFGKLFFVGETAGLAQVAKLANNLLAAAAMVVSSEAMVMAAKAGIEPQIMLDIINAGSGRNSATQDKFPRSVLPGTFDFGFATGLSYKDVRLCVDEAEAMGVPMVAGAAVRQMLAVTQAKFGPASDFTSVCRVVEEWAGVQVRSVQLPNS
ncbi:NAD(P)-dependent oxidoreductase [Tabrizicola sp. WMC-M-20]|nr:NAD(P)-dependent oxidoreductase [Tabrizicola sp. WMC-M-20]